MTRESKTILIAVLISFLIHVFLLGSVYLYLDRNPYESPAEQIIEIDLTKDNFRIADILKPKVEKRPEEAKHWGLYDSSVKDETVREDNFRAPGRPVSRGGEGMEKVKKGIGEYQLKSGTGDFFGEGKGEKTPNRPQLKSMPEDFYPDYKRGNHTFINVLKHQDVAYFVRLKRVFKLAWDPTGVLMTHRMHGEVSRGSIKVVLGLSIDPTGKLTELFVINSSGLDGYDGEAMRAVRVSSPFSSPPKKLLENDGILRVAWTFVVYI